MALYYDLPVYRDTYRLILRIFEVTKDFPRDYKYTLGQDMKRDALQLVRSIYRANRSRDKAEPLAQRCRPDVPCATGRLWQGWMSCAYPPYCRSFTVTSGRSQFFLQPWNHHNNVENVMNRYLATLLIILPLLAAGQAVAEDITFCVKKNGAVRVPAKPGDQCRKSESPLVIPSEGREFEYKVGDTGPGGGHHLFRRLS